DRSSRSAIRKSVIARLPALPSSRAALHRVEHLDLLAVAHLGGGPLAARHDLAIHRDRDATAIGRAGGDHGHLDRRGLAQLPALAVERHDRHARRPSTTLKGSDPSRVSPARSAATASPVTGASRTPLRQWPVAQINPLSSGSAPTIGRLSGVPGRRPAFAPTSSSSPISGSTSHAASSRRKTPSAVTAVSKPCSSTVAPSTTRPSPRDTR